MEGWQMYSKIQQLKTQGFSMRKASRIVRVSRNTITKYWEMTPDEYAATYKAVNRVTALMAHESTVVKWLETYPCMTAAQARDWMEEKYQLDTSDRTVRRFVARLREKYGITRQMEPKREYEAVEELPKGYKLQLDFGEKTVRHAYSSRYIKLYFVAFTLSYSRYQWGKFQERPFLSTDLVGALYGCFDYFCGMPRQLVYDQDSIIVVSENSGDIIHTQSFAAFLAESKMEVRVCRKSDPETKGMIESSVKFIKGSFMENRLYMGIDLWNQAFEDWLIRAAKRKHGTTKRKPVEMFAEEQGYLLPLYGVAPAGVAEEMDRAVRPDNTVWYKSNRYSVPYGTYGREKMVFLTVVDSQLQVIGMAGDILATHEICKESGRLIRPANHRRDKNAMIRELRDKTVALLGEEFREYLTALCEAKPRYVKEQLEIIVCACETYGRACVMDAMRYCQELELYSANDLNDAAKSMLGQQQVDGTQLARAERLPVDDDRYHIPVQKRSLSAYAEAATGSVVTQ